MSPFDILATKGLLPLSAILCWLPVLGLLSFYLWVL